MARLFDDGSSEYLRYSGAVLSSYPITMAGWGYTDDAAVNGTILALAFSAGDLPYKCILFNGGFAGDPVGAFDRDNAGTSGFARTTTGFSTNTWHHAAGVFTNVSSRSAYIDGGSKATNTTTLSTSSLTRTSIGTLWRPSTVNYFSGRIAEVGIWNVALDDDEIAALAAGLCPLLVRPNSLVDYWPLGGMWNDANVGNAANSDFSLIKSFHAMDPQNTPSTADHPPGIIYPFSGMQITGAAAAPATGQPMMRRWGGVPHMNTFTGRRSW
jgi:hypothetical protein